MSFTGLLLDLGASDGFGDVSIFFLDLCALVFFWYKGYENT
jgi:hypothetical protein